MYNQLIVFAVLVYTRPYVILFMVLFCQMLAYIACNISQVAVWVDLVHALKQPESPNEAENVTKTKVLRVIHHISSAVLWPHLLSDKIDEKFLDNEMIPELTKKTPLLGVKKPK